MGVIYRNKSAKTENTLSQKEVGTGSLEKDVKVINEKDAVKVRDKLQDAKCDKNGTTLTFKASVPDEFKNLSKGDIFVLPSAGKKKEVTEELSIDEMLFKDMMDRTIIGKVSEVKEDSGNLSVTFINPTIDEVFNKIEGDINKSLDTKNTSMRFLEGITVYASTSNDKSGQKNYKKDFSLGEEASASAFAETVLTSDGILLENAGLEVNNINIIKFKNNNGVKANGKIAFTDTAFTGRLYYEEDSNEIPKKIDTSIRTNGDFTIDLAFALENKGKIDILKDKETSNNVVEIQGVDNEPNEITIGYILDDLGMLRVGFEDVTKKDAPVELAYGIIFTATLDGQVQANATLGYNFSAYIDKGFSIKYDNGNFKDEEYNVFASQSYPNHNKDDELRQPTKEEIASKPESKITLQGNISGDLNLATGIDPLLYVGNINVARLSNDLGCKGNFVLEGKAEYPGDHSGNMKIHAKAYIASKFSAGLKITAKLTNDWKLTMGGTIEKNLLDLNLKSLDMVFPEDKNVNQNITLNNLDPQLKQYIPSHIKDYQFAYLNLRGDEEKEALILCNEGGFIEGNNQSSSEVYMFEKTDGVWNLFDKPLINQKHSDLDSMELNNMIYLGSLKINNYDSPVFLMHGAGYSYNYQAIAVFVYNKAINDFDYYGGIFTRLLDIYKDNKLPQIVLAESKNIRIDSQKNEITVDDGVESITHLTWDGKNIVVSSKEQKVNEVKTDLVLTRNDGMSDDEYYGNNNKKTIKLKVGQTVYFEQAGEIMYSGEDGTLYKWIDKTHLKTLKKGTFEIWLKSYGRHFVFQIE